MGVGVGEGGTDGTAVSVSCGAIDALSVRFFPVVLFWIFRRGEGVLRGCAIESPSLLKKSPMGLPAVAEWPPAKNTISDKIKMIILTGDSIAARTLHVPHDLFNL